MMDDWISVEDRLPEVKGDPVLVYGTTEVDQSYRAIGALWYEPPQLEAYSPAGRKLNITHWQPLPEPPTEDELEAQAWVLFRFWYHQTEPGDQDVSRAMTGLFEILKNRNPNWAERLREGDPIIERQRKIEEIQDLIEWLDPDG
jgi:hypothetical protein